MSKLTYIQFFVGKILIGIFWIWSPSGFIWYVLSFFKRIRIKLQPNEGKLFIDDGLVSLSGKPEEFLIKFYVF